MWIEQHDADWVGHCHRSNPHALPWRANNVAVARNARKAGGQSFSSTSDDACQIGSRLIRASVDSAPQPVTETEMGLDEVARGPDPTHVLDLPDIDQRRGAMTGGASLDAGTVKDTQRAPSRSICSMFTACRADVSAPESTLASIESIPSSSSDTLSSAVRGFHQLPILLPRLILTGWRLQELEHNRNI